MNFIEPIEFINIDEFDYIISIGNKCPTAMTLRSLELYKESFPFDYIPTTPALILQYLQSTDNFFPERNNVKNKDKVWFGHFNINDKYDETIQTFQNRFRRLYSALENKAKILFVYTSEADVYNEFGNRYNNNYTGLCNIISYIQNTYQYNNITILAIHTNKSFTNTENIKNYTMTVPDKYLSDDGSTHKYPIFSEYRKVLKKLIQKIFQK